LSGSYEVDGSGNILIPVLGSLRVVGMSAEAIAQQVRSLAEGRYLNSVNVSASINPYPKSSSPLLPPAEARRYFRETARVSPDGSVFLPVVGRLQAAGKTLESLNNEVIEILKTHYRAQIDVYLGLGDSAALNVYVLGEVRTPGRLAYTPSMSLLQAIAAAGGVNEGGDLRRVRLVHRTGIGSVVVYTTDLKAVLSGNAKGSQNIQVSPSDLIFVARTDIANIDLAVDQYIRRLLPFGASINYSYIGGEGTAVDGVSR
jgi:protein involved in polysaccharide export with SLBB domain